MKTKELQVIEQFEEFILPRIYELFEQKLKSALSSGAVPDEFYKEDNNLLARAIFDSICKDRPFQARAGQYKEDFKNIHICI